MNEYPNPPTAALIPVPLFPPLHSPPRILVVDDDEDIRRLNAEALTHAGYTVDAAEDGATAWEAINSVRYDLLVTDNTMPNVSGMELIGMIQANHLPLPVIMASGTLPLEAFNRHPALKPAAMLCKPYLLEALVQTVRRVLAGPCLARMG